MRLAVIAEGITDQIAIEYIVSEVLARTLGVDPAVNYIQPPLDETDTKQGDFGGWKKALESCGSKLADALTVNDFAIVHLDTDIAEQMGIPLTDGGADRSHEDILHDISMKIRESCGESLPEVEGRVIFAIAHHSIECWLIILLFPRFTGDTTKGCEKKLHTLFAKQGVAFRKDAKFFHQVCRQIKIKDATKVGERNDSLGSFVTALLQLA